MYYLRDEPAVIQLEGVNGTVFTLTGDLEGDQGVILNKGPQGLAEAPRKTLWRQSATQDGASFQGVTVEPLDLVLGFQVWGQDRDWDQRSSNLRKALDYEREATLFVTTASGRRSLKVRMLEEPKRDQEFDGRWTQYSLETYTFRAGWPFWESETDYQTVTFSGSATKQIKVSNYTDTPCYPEWALTAPGVWEFPDKDFSDSSTRMIRTPTLGVGQGLVVNTYPLARPYVAADNSNMAGRFGGVLPLNIIPKYTPETSLPVRFEGAGSATCTLKMRRFWNSPWGGE